MMAILVVLFSEKREDTWGRLEICQKIYTTRFFGQKLYTLKVSKLQQFLLKKKQRKCINIIILVAFLLEFMECLKF